jgi:4-carboxymuconolactone decarboxylase
LAAIPYPDPDSLPGLAEAYAEITGIRGRVSNLYRVMSHAPEGLRAYIGLSHYVRDQSSLPPPLRELAILQTGVTIGSEYEKFHHIHAGRAAGLPEVKIQAVLDGTREPFDESELAVLDYARGVAASRSAASDLLARLRQHLSLRQISDLIITVGMYHMCAAILLPMQVEIDPEPN